jgi:hypothetical protein
MNGKKDSKKMKTKPTHARIAHVEVTPNGILIKSIHLHDENGEYIRDAKLNGQILCTLTEHLLKITICK